LIVRCGPRHHGALVALPITAEVVMCRPDGQHRELADIPCPWFASGVFDVNGDAVALIDLDLLLEPGASRPGHGNPVLTDLLIEGAARDAEPLRGPFDPTAFSA
jgi:hypothetical protein